MLKAPVGAPRRHKRHYAVPFPREVRPVPQGAGVGITQPLRRGSRKAGVKEQIGVAPLTNSGDPKLVAVLQQVSSTNSEGYK